MCLCRYIWDILKYQNCLLFKSHKQPKQTENNVKFLIWKIFLCNVSIYGHKTSKYLKFSQFMVFRISKAIIKNEDFYFISFAQEIMDSGQHI